MALALAGYRIDNSGHRRGVGLLLPYRVKIVLGAPYFHGVFRARASARTPLDYGALQRGGRSYQRRHGLPGTRSSFPHFSPVHEVIHKALLAHKPARTMGYCSDSVQAPVRHYRLATLGVHYLDTLAVVLAAVI